MYMYMHMYIYNIYIIYLAFTTEGLFGIAIESWPEWDLNPRPLNSVQTLQPTELSSHGFKMHSGRTLYSYSNFIIVQYPILFRLLSASAVTHIFYNMP